MAKTKTQISEQLKTRAMELRAQASTTLAEAEDLFQEAKRLEREERQAKEAAERTAHYWRMYQEIGRPLAGLNEAQHDIVYGQAWDQGHASGFGEVKSYYGEFAEMARKLLEAK